MPTFKTFEDIEAWRLARELSKEIYEITLTGTFAKDYGLRDQINKSSGSVMDNIAEGFERGGNREFIQFLSISKASCAEVRSQLYRALDRKHINDEQFERFKNKSIIISKKISSLMSYLMDSPIKGQKFQEPNEDYLRIETLNLEP